MHSRFCRVRTFIVYIQRIGMLESNKRKMRKIELKFNGNDDDELMMIN
jgi:hypothetical protein